MRARILTARFVGAGSPGGKPARSAPYNLVSVPEQHRAVFYVLLSKEKHANGSTSTKDD
jgi:hypothetical protein